MVDTNLRDIKYNHKLDEYMKEAGAGVLNELFLACKELIEDAKVGCADLVFKDVCLDVLSRARLVLTNEEFEELNFFVAEKLKEKTVSDPGWRVRVQ
jgi:hypothetical protein